MKVKRTWKFDNGAWKHCDDTSNEVITTLVQGDNDSYTYTSEDGTQTSWYGAGANFDFTGIVDVNTDINIWIDTTSLGAISISEITLMKNKYLKETLLPYYGGDYNLPLTHPTNVAASDAYNLRTEVIQKTGERFLEWIGNKALRAGASGVINIIFQDESSSNYHVGQTTENDGGVFDPSDARRSNYNTDLNIYRTRVFAEPTGFYKSAVIAYQSRSVEPARNTVDWKRLRKNFNNFIHSMTYGIGNYADTNGVSDYYAEGNWIFYPNALDNSPAVYWNNIVLDIISQFKPL